MNPVSDSQKCLEEETFGSWVLVHKPKGKPKSLAKLGVDKTAPSAAVNSIRNENRPQ